jgi:hypothetical protein
MKTGFVCASGFNLVATASRNGRRLIAVVMGMRNSAARAAAAKALLLSGFEQQPVVIAGIAGPKTNGIKVADVINLPQGQIVPVDMTQTVCRNKAPVVVQDGLSLAGWAASFGTYDTADKAQMALRGRVLSPAGLTVKGSAGVIKLPDGSGFAPIIWGLDQVQSNALCATYKLDGAHCTILPESLMVQIASEAKARKAAQEAQAEIIQGSDGSVAGSPSRLKYKRRFGH